MDPLPQAAALVLAQRLSSLQEELEEYLKRPGKALRQHDLHQLKESIRQLKDRIDSLK